MVKMRAEHSFCHTGTPEHKTVLKLCENNGGKARRARLQISREAWRDELVGVWGLGSGEVAVRGHSTRPRFLGGTECARSSKQAEDMPRSAILDLHRPDIRITS